METRVVEVIWTDGGELSTFEVISFEAARPRAPTQEIAPRGIPSTCVLSGG
jgi:hypothetical protein